MLEVELQPELNLARTNASLRIGDHAKGRVVEVCGDAVEAEATKAVPVENIERCHTKLEIALFTAKVDVLQQGEVLAQQSRFAELRDSAGRISVFHVGWTAERRRVDVREAPGIVRIKLRVLQGLARHKTGPCLPSGAEEILA